MGDNFSKNHICIDSSYDLYSFFLFLFFFIILYIDILSFYKFSNPLYSHICLSLEGQGLGSDVILFEIKGKRKYIYNLCRTLSQKVFNGMESRGRGLMG